jgi:hypothetical protein
MKIFCDKCNRFIIDTPMFKVSETITPIYLYDTSYYLCGYCQKRLKDWLDEDNKKENNRSFI